jgi:predicted CxxxxCH...CXXCH cytochrome family protein
VAGSGPATGRHADHPDSQFYITGCTDCHEHSGALGGNHANTTTENTVSYAAGDCTQSCHDVIPGSAGDWLDSPTALACLDCHQGGMIAAGAVPSSGLHTAVPSVTGETHDDAFDTDKTCASCHSGLGGTHIDGTPTLDTVANFGLDASITYNQTVANNGEGTCTTACHVGRADWEHVWTLPANTGDYTSATAACLGCHGDDSNNFNTGITHVRSTDGADADAIYSMHGGGGTYACSDCHNLESSTGYTFTFGSADWSEGGETSTHGNAGIEINSTGTSYDTVNHDYCDACHPATPAAAFSDTGWGVNLAAGDAVTVGCGGCHVQGVTASSTDAYHATHGLDHTTDMNEGEPKCEVCHGNNGGSGFSSTPSGTHNDGNAVIQLLPAYSYSGTVVAWDAGYGTCSNVQCHFSTTTPTWMSGTTDCTSCHNDGSVAVPGAVDEAWPATNQDGTAKNGSEAHGAHVGHTGFVTGANCTDCHANNNDGTHDAIDGDGTVVEADVTAGAKVSVYTPAAGTCTNSCHDGATADFTDAAPGVACDDRGGFGSGHGPPRRPPGQPVLHYRVHRLSRTQRRAGRQSRQHHDGEHRLLLGRRLHQQLSRRRSREFR